MADAILAPTMSGPRSLLYCLRGAGFAEGGDVAEPESGRTTAAATPVAVVALSLPVRTGRADIHMHTDVGDGHHSPAAILDYTEHETDLDVIAITDHDEVYAALVTRELAEQRGGRVCVITGTEVTTKGGHVLALFVERDFRMFKSLDRTLAEIHEAGGVAIAPHPLSWLTTAVSAANLRRIVALGAAGRASGVYFDGIEVLNPSLAGRVAYRRVRDHNRAAWHLPAIAGSDAHAKHLIGTAYTTFPGRTPEDFRAALAAGTTRAHGRFWTLGETRDIARVSMYRAWVTLPVRRVRRKLGLLQSAPRLLAPTAPRDDAGVAIEATVPVPAREKAGVGSDG